MANKPQKPKPEAPKEAAQEVTRHSKSDLIANAAAFGIKPEIMVGALYGVTEASKEEASKRIKAFLSKGVK
jgi:hypothetical protein